MHKTRFLPVIHYFGVYGVADHELRNFLTKAGILKMVFQDSSCKMVGEYIKNDKNKIR